MKNFDCSYTRPTGKDISAYEGYSDWSARHWAWEFLRRNAEFVKACDSRAGDRASRLEVAQKYGLKRFKHYSEPYFCKDDQTPAQRPVFLEGAISVKSNVTASPGKRKAVQLELEYGHVAIIFDLRKTLKKTRSIKKMLDAAENSLLRRQRRIFKHSNSATPSKNQPKGGRFLVYLRLLDLLDSNVNQGEALQIANGQNGEEKTVVSGQKLQQIEEANACREHRYLEVALMKKKKPAKR